MAIPCEVAKKGKPAWLDHSVQPNNQPTAKIGAMTASVDPVV
jgi:hypothetical protein